MRNRNLLESFRIAFSGLWYALRTQRNTRIHLSIAAAAIALGLWLGLSPDQWALLTLTISFVLVSEMLNTTMETFVDLVSPDYHPLAKTVKDVVAGTVLLTAITSVIVGLLVLGRPIIQVLFEGGEFTADSTSVVYFALQFYALGLVTHSMLEVVTRAFFAQQDTVTPLVVSFFTTALNVALAFWLVRPLLHGGLALANSIAIGVESLVGLAILHRRWGSVEARRMATAVLKSGVAAAAMGGAIVAFERFVTSNPFYLATIGGALGVLVYFGVAAFLRMDELRVMSGVVLQRLRGLRATGGAN